MRCWNRLSRKGEEVFKEGVDVALRDSVGSAGGLGDLERSFLTLMIL